MSQRNRSHLLSFRLARLSLLLFLCTHQAWSSEPNEPGFFRERIRPLLEDQCYACHTDSALGGLRVDSREGLLSGGSRGPAIVPGDPANSLLIQAVTHAHKELKMPMNAGQLTSREIGDLKAWIREGAAWPKEAAVPSSTIHQATVTPQQRKFWSFQPIEKPAPHKVRNQRWPKSPIDLFVLARLEEAGLTPVAAAHKRTLIRRATYDLIGLPPTPEEVDSFLADPSQDAFAKVVDRLLASPHYGERWGRYWLDLARYADDQYWVQPNTEPITNGFRYRDWVIRAFNSDMPYDLFVKAQIAGDSLNDTEHEDLAAGLGFYAMSPLHQDDRVDVTTRSFLGLTVACAQCHDHKYDPVFMKDFYALQGIFNSTELSRAPLVAEDVVSAYESHKTKVEKLEGEVKDFLEVERGQLSEVLAGQASKYLMGCWEVLGPKAKDLQVVAKEKRLRRHVLERWLEYVQSSLKKHSLLEEWAKLLVAGEVDDVLQSAQEFQSLLVSVIREQKGNDEQRRIVKEILKREPDAKVPTPSMERDRYLLWEGLFFSGEHARKNKGSLYFTDDEIVEGFLQGDRRNYVLSRRSNLQRLKDALPPEYPFSHVIRDRAEPKNMRIRIRGDKKNLGPEAPRAFLSILSEGEPEPFEHGSGRLELAEAIVSLDNPLTARVMVNRIWHYHFGKGIVKTLDNFGQLGERPTHPALLDYLASRFMESGWSIKTLHREIMLSATYALSSKYLEKNFTQDPENRLLWRANRRRLDAEALRDSLLYVAGKLDLTLGGQATLLAEEDTKPTGSLNQRKYSQEPPPFLPGGNNRRTVYGHVSRVDLDTVLPLFDFPDPTNMSVGRVHTNVAIQKLFFLNSYLVERLSQALARRLESEAGPDPQRMILRAYRLLFGRSPNQKEMRVARDYLKEETASWERYTQTLLSSNEFLYVD